MNHKKTAYYIIKNSPIPINLINIKYINKQVGRCVKSRKDFEKVKMYIHQFRRKKVYRR